jgi:hypothetical protein
VIDGEAETWSVLFHVTCHNESARRLTRVVFPSGAEPTGLGPEASCRRCHQGRTSTDCVEEAIGGLPPDQVSDELDSIKVHRVVSAATRIGAQACGAYQYSGTGAPSARYARRSDLHDLRPPPMIDAAERALQRLHLRPSQVHSECYEMA